MECSEYAELASAIGLWATGGLGAWFVWRQNRFLHRQNSIMENQTELMAKQNTALESQKKVNELLLKQENDRQDEIVKSWCKRAFLACGNSGGMLQTTGGTLRRRFGNQSIYLILSAYEELLNEEPGRNFPSLSKFGELMLAIDSSSWSGPVEYFSKPRY